MQPTPRGTRFRSVLAGSGRTPSGTVGFHPLLAQTALLYLVMTALVSGIQSLFDGRWQWYTGHGQILGLAGLLLPYFNARVRHHRQAAGGALVGLLAALVAIHWWDVPLLPWVGVAMVAASAAFAGVTRLPTWFFTRADTERDGGV
jgi:hypothetical protein